MNKIKSVDEYLNMDKKEMALKCLKRSSEDQLKIITMNNLKNRISEALENDGDFVAPTEELVRNLIPRLKESGFGCKIDLGGFTYKTMINEEEYVSMSPIGRCNSEIGSLKHNKGCIKKIIGHEIKLEDVLEMLEINDYCHKRDEDFLYSVYVEMMSEKTGLIEECWIDSFFWKYGKPYSQQTKETQKVISKLII